MSQLQHFAESDWTARTADSINAEHALALHHADAALGHARRIGLLLTEAKAALAHGEFMPWVAANIAFSMRQAQRYMAAAQGKPLPVRKIASLPKNDTVSLLTLSAIPMPSFKSGEFLRAIAVVADGWHDEFLLMPTVKGRAYIAHINGPADGDHLADKGAVCTWRRSSVDVSDLPRLPLVFSFPWERAEIVERRPHPGFESNPFAEVLP